VLLTPANAQQANEQRAVITVRDVSGLKGTPVPLGLQMHAPAPEGTLVTAQIGNVPKGASLSDGSRMAVAAIEQDLIDVTGWDLPNLTFLMRPEVTGQFTLTAVVTVENGARPLFTQASFVVNIGDDRASLPSGAVLTVQADVGPYQIAVRTTVERKPAEQAQAGPRVSAPGQTVQETKSAMDSLRGAMAETARPDLGPATSAETSMPKKPARAQPGRRSGPQQQATAEPVRRKVMKAARASKALVGQKSPARKAEAEPVRGQVGRRTDRPRAQARNQREQRRQHGPQTQTAHVKGRTALTRREVAPAPPLQLPQGLEPIYRSQ
jgi:hypothetical protein